MTQTKAKPAIQGWRFRLHEIIFEADTPTGKMFDIFLLVTIVMSIIVVMLDSVGSVRSRHGQALIILEWTFTILFSAEYVLRLLCVGKPWLYAKSFYGIIDLLAVIPTYISVFIPGSRYLLVIRALRMLRIFRVLKVVQYVNASTVLTAALKASRQKITVFLFTVLNIVIIMGSLMYLVEGPQNGFTSIPLSVYWCIVTLTTVGYGDISPQTGIGQMIAAIIMIMGYGIIAVPTGIVSAEMMRSREPVVSTQSCPQCSSEGHSQNAKYCKDCGAKL
jgi:voltage-gated potassium channel